jgi:hypothetical protein
MKLFALTLSIISVILFTSATNEIKSDKYYETYIYFDKDWKYLGLQWKDLSGERNILSSELLSRAEFNELKNSQCRYMRRIWLTEAMIFEYSMGKKVYPQCNNNMIVTDFFYSKVDGKHTVQSIMSRLYSLYYDEQRNDKVDVDGQMLAFNIDGSGKSEDYVRIFDTGKNRTYIKALMESKNGIQECVGFRYMFMNVEGSKSSLLLEINARKSATSFLFINQKRNERLHFRVALPQLLEGIATKNDIVYEFSPSKKYEDMDFDNPKVINKDKYQFFRDYFNDYPNLKLRMLTRANEIPVNDNEGGRSRDYINDFMIKLNSSYKEAIDIVIYDSFIGGYNNDKSSPFTPFFFNKECQSLEECVQNLNCQ